MAEIYALKIERDLTDNEFGMLMEYVTEDKRQRISRFYRLEDKQRSLLSDVLSRYSICKKSGKKNSDIVIGKNDFGKPILIKPEHIHFNLSHSGDWVVCGTDNEALGIDVEQIKPIDFSIAEKYYAEAEYKALMEQPEDRRLNFFYRIWTLKESYIKAEGKGLSIPLNSFWFKFEPKCISVFSQHRSSSYYFHQLDLDESHILALCSSSEESALRIMSLAELMENLKYI